MPHRPVHGVLVCTGLSGNLGLLEEAYDGPQTLFRVFP